MNFIQKFLAARRLKRIFGAHVDPERIDGLVGSDAGAEGTARECEITPFFATVCGYVGIAEQLPLALLPELMNGYYAACTAAIETNGGALDKFVGDSVVAMFGAPTFQRDHALRACLAALDLQERMDGLRVRFATEPGKWPACVQDFHVRIGIHTGTAIVGNMGTVTRFNFSMMGDNVNLAARLEKYAATYGVPILCSRATKHACDVASPGRIRFRPLGCVEITGRTEPLEIFEPVSRQQGAAIA